MSEPLIPDNILRFLNALPTTGDTVAWILQFRAALQELLGDVDRIGLNINMVYDPMDANIRSRRRWVNITQHTRVDVSVNMSLPVAGKQYSLEELIAEWRRLGHPLDEYQAPICYEYYLPNRCFIASLLLFRKKGCSPISMRTLQTIEALRLFLLVAFSGVVARHFAVRPVDLLFARVMVKAWNTAKLTSREMQVMALHLFGLSYAQIACQLFISENTVAKHVKAAHRKTGCESFLELFRPYFRESFSEAE